MKLDSIKRRREERLRELREKMKSNAKHGDVDYKTESDFQSSERFSRRSDLNWDEETSFTSESDDSSVVSPRFIVKIVLSLFILSAAYLVSQSDLPSAQKAEGFLYQVMNREFNFQGVAANVEKYMGHQFAILPTFTEQEKNIQPAWNRLGKEGGYMSPVKGDIAAPFDGQGIKVSTTAGSELKAIDEGWVIFVGDKEGLGQTIMIEHADKTVSLYGSVNQAKVKLQDWVQPGQVIGIADGESLFFSLQKNKEFIDPTSVIPFE
jgi:stage IV sporulation protein FA